MESQGRPTPTVPEARAISMGGRNNPKTDWSGYNKGLRWPKAMRAIQTVLQIMVFSPHAGGRSHSTTGVIAEMAGKRCRPQRPTGRLKRFSA